MPEFWVASGHHLTRQDASGHLAVTDELLLAILARPELMPPPEACEAERSLHRALSQLPRLPVGPDRLQTLADPEARENWALFLTLRDLLLTRGSVEAATLAMLRDAIALPAIFRDQLIQLCMRNALDGCDDPMTLRAAELFFRPQRAHIKDGALMLADDELAAELESRRHVDPLGLLLSGGLDGLDVIGSGNAWTYWSRSDAYSMVLPFGADPEARAGLGRAIAAFLRHMIGLEVRIEPVTESGAVPMRWFVGLNAEGTALGNALWRGETAPAASLIGLFALTPVDPQALAPDLADRLDGEPVWLLLGLGEDNVIRLKPQNLIAGLPLSVQG